MSTKTKHVHHTKLAIDVFDCCACRTDEKFPSCLRPGDSLEGQIRVRTESNESFRAATVRLQGIQLGSVYIVNAKYPYGAVLQTSFKFMDIPYQILSQFRSSQDSLSFLFQFILPRSEARTDNSRPLQCQQLPPSFNVRNSYAHKWMPNSLPQSSIVYKLHCEVQLQPVDGSSLADPLTIIAEREINFLPYVEPQPPTYMPQPPTYMPNCPSEFVLQLQRPVRRRFWSQPLGSVMASTQEPHPLVYTSDSLAPHTECNISFTFSGHSIDAKFCDSISIQISPALRSKTFFSVETMPCVPTQALLARSKPLRLYDDVTKMGDLKFRNLSWNYVPAINSQIDDILSSKAPSLTTPSSPSVYDKVPRQQSSQPLVESSRAALGSWNTSIRFRVSPEKKQQPTFCTDLLARSYSLLFRVRISGAYVEMLVLEVPVQVVYPHTTAQTPELLSPHKESPCLGRIALDKQASSLPDYYDT